jgi:hypothetical protein
MTVNKYLNKFTQMSRYAPDEVNTDEKKHDAFLNGLNDKIQFQLLNTDYEDFQKMVDKAIIIENKIKEIEKNGKRKTSFSGQSSGSKTRPHLPQSGLSSETRVWFVRQCMDNVLHSICNNQTFRCSARTSRCRNLSHRLIDPVRSNRLARTYSKALAQPLKPHRMHQLKEAIMIESVSSVG